MHSYTNRTITGINYNFLNIAGKTLLQFVSGIVLARLIQPKDFGILGMAYLFIGLANLFSSMGLGPAVIQKNNITNEHIRIASTLALTGGLLVYILFWFLSPYIAGFFNTQEVISIIRVISIIFIFQGLYSISYGLVIRDLDFKTIFIIETTSLAAGQGLASIILAIYGYGVWSLVYGRLITVFISCILFILKVRFPLKPLFKKKEAYELFSFGSGVSLANILNYSATNIDYLVIGKLLTPADLGLYTKAYNIMTLPLSQVYKHFREYYFQLTLRSKMILDG
jgi:PST family polysaccharide transporter